MKFIAYDKKVEVNETTVNAFVKGLGPFKNVGMKILKECGIENIILDAWYSQQAWLNAFTELQNRYGDNILYEVGQKIPSNAIFPPEIDGVEKALASIDVAYKINHRYGEIGKYEFQKVSDTKVNLICENPYPCSFDHGLIEGMIQKFKTQDIFGIKVSHDPYTCRSRGDSKCIYNISWILPPR